MSQRVASFAGMVKRNRQSSGRINQGPEIPSTTRQYEVSKRGQMTLLAEIRRRWNMVEGGTIDAVDLGTALIVVPSGSGGFQGMLSEAITQSGGYESLAAQVAAAEPGLT